MTKPNEDEYKRLKEGAAPTNDTAKLDDSTAGKARDETLSYEGLTPSDDKFKPVASITPGAPSVPLYGTQFINQTSTAIRQDLQSQLEKALGWNEFSIAKLIKSIIDGITEAFGKMFQTAWEWIKNPLEFVGKTIIGAAKLAADGITWAAEKISDVATGTVNAIKSAVDWASEADLGTIGNIITAPIKGLIGVVGGIISGLFVNSHDAEIKRQEEIAKRNAAITALQNNQAETEKHIDDLLSYGTFVVKRDLTLNKWSGRSLCAFEPFTYGQNRGVYMENSTENSIFLGSAGAWNVTGTINFVIPNYWSQNITSVEAWLRVYYPFKRGGEVYYESIIGRLTDKLDVSVSVSCDNGNASGYGSIQRSDTTGSFTIADSFVTDEEGYRVDIEIRGGFMVKTIGLYNRSGNKNADYSRINFQKIDSKVLRKG